MLAMLAFGQVSLGPCFRMHVVLAMLEHGPVLLVLQLVCNVNLVMRVPGQLLLVQLLHLNAMLVTQVFILSIAPLSVYLATPGPGQVPSWQRPVAVVFFVMLELGRK